jgi:hypothetical protein
MARKNENVGDSVQQSDGLTTGRRRQEKRVASGNTRRGQAATEKEVSGSAKRKSASKKRK